MTVRMGEYLFDVAHYDSEGDVLYLHIGPPRPAAASRMTPEQHLWRLDQNGQVIGITISGAKRILERDGAIGITPPSMKIDAETVNTALAGAC